MAEDKFDPVKEFINLRDKIGRTVEKQIRTVSGATETPYPPVDVYETSENVHIRTTFLNGQKPADLEISMEKDVLTISGKTIDTLDVPTNSYLHRELSYGAFSRSITIPRKVKADAARASFKNGILTITLPRVENDSATIIGVTPTE